MSDAEYAPLFDLAVAQVLDPEHRILSWTAGAERLYGWSAKEAVGRVVSELLRTRFSESIEHIRTRLAVDGEWIGELGQMTKSGAEIAVVSRWALHRGEHGEPSAILAVDTALTKVRPMDPHRTLNSLESVTDGFYTVDLDWRFTKVNDQCARYLGKTRDELLGRVVWDTFPGLHGTIVEQKLRQTMDEGVTAHFDTLSPLSHRWLEIAAQRMPDGVGVHFRDVTERKWSQEQRERFLALGADLLIFAGLDGIFKWVSPAWERTFGWKASELTAHPWLFFVHPDDREATVATAERLFGGEEIISFENRYRCADGTYRWLSWWVRPYLDEQVLYGAAMDVTERKLAEDALRESEHRFRSAFEQAAVGIVHTSATGRILRINKRFCQMIGYERHDIVGRSLSELTPMDGVASTRDLLASAVPGVEHPESVDQRYVHANGEIVYAHVTATLVEDDTGSEPYVMAVVEDVTERQLLEEQLRQAQRMESVGRLAGGVAHDFNNLLTIIAGYSDLTLRRLSDDDPLRDNVLEISGAAERAAGLTRQLLAFGRKQLLTPKVLDLNTVVADMSRMLERLIGEEITLVAIPDLALGRTKADPGQIEQVIVNLAVNARDAMRNGGTLTIETANVDLDENYVHSHIEAAPGSYVMLAVSDTGSGMDPEVAAHVFEPFFTTKSVGEGTGLGLSTVYGIVKQSSGSIALYTEPGRGTSFKIYLPRVDEDVAVAPETVAAVSRSGGETVLVVEDEEKVRDLAIFALRHYGYDVVEAGDVDDAIRVCQERDTPIHLLLTDVVMPKLNGRELADRLKATLPDLRVVFMSGYTENAIVHHGVLDPGAHFIHKPFTAEQLARKVREVLDAPS